MNKSITWFFLLTTASVAMAETREHSAHEHGVGELNIAIDGTQVAMEFHAPGADIVGFEYKAKSAEDRAAIDEAVALLARPGDLFVLPDAAACTVTQASAGLGGEEPHEEHEEQGHDDHADHDTEEVADHSEFHAEYLLTCANPTRIDGIEFAYFERFKNARELEVQIVTTSGAQAFEVERAVPVLDLRNLF